MGKSRASTQSQNHRKPNNSEREPVKVPAEVRHFMKRKTLKKWLKKEDQTGYFTKKDEKKLFNSWRSSVLPDVIEWLYRFGHIREQEEVRNDLYNILLKKDVIKLMKKSLTDDELFIENIELFPVIAYDIIRLAEEWDRKAKEENPKHECFDLDDLINLVKTINKKNIKKMVKKGVPEDLAFDLLCVYPVNGLIRPKTAKTMVRVRQIFQIIYAHAKEKKVDVEKIFGILFKREQYQSVISFAMLERKEKYVNFTDTQKEAFNAISVWVFKKLEAMDKEDIAICMKEYFNARKRDKAQNKDSARRFFVGSLPEDEYPRIVSVVNRLKQSDSSIEEFL